METLWAMLLNSVPTEEETLMPVLDEPSKEEMTARPAAEWWEDDLKVPGSGSTLWKRLSSRKKKLLSQS